MKQLAVHLAGLFLLAATPGPASADTDVSSASPSGGLGDLQVLAIDAPERAVLRWRSAGGEAHGDLRVVAPGDVLDPSSWGGADLPSIEVMAITGDVVVAEVLDGGDPPTRLRVWIHRAPDAASPSRLTRLDPRSPVREPLRRPIYQTPNVETGEAAGGKPGAARAGEDGGEAGAEEAGAEETGADDERAAEGREERP